MSEDDDIGIDGIDLDEDEVDPDQIKVYFERRKESDHEYPDTYREAKIRERSDGTETLQIKLTARQLQGWADTLGAKLSDARRRVGDSLASIDEVYVLHLTEDGMKRELLGAAFTRRSAEDKRAELAKDVEKPWSQDVVVETTPLFTD